MKHEQIIKLAREAAEGRYATNLTEAHSLVGFDEVARFAQLTTDHALEEAAKACEAGIDQAKESELNTKAQSLRGKNGELEALKFWSTVSRCNDAHKRCAAVIRAIKGKPATPTLMAAIKGERE